VRRTLAWTVAAVVAFGLGIALGEALHDNPSPGGPQTAVRTLAPLPIAPAHETVTVTVPSP
jgi:hypothetical protein